MYHRVYYQHATHVNNQLPFLMATETLRTGRNTLNSENIHTSFMGCFSGNWPLSQTPKTVLRFSLSFKCCFYKIFSQISFTKAFMESHNTKNSSDFLIIVCLVKQEIFINTFLSLHHHQKKIVPFHMKKKKENGEFNRIFSISCYY